MPDQIVEIFTLSAATVAILLAALAAIRWMIAPGDARELASIASRARPAFEGGEPALDEQPIPLDAQTMRRILQATGLSCGVALALPAGAIAIGARANALNEHGPSGHEALSLVEILPLGLVALVLALGFLFATLSPAIDKVEAVTA